MSTLKAARADNFYIPRTWDPSQGSRNQHSNARALRSHNKKYKNGVPCIRFEIPFHVRCHKCENMIAKGVRFNSEKRTIGQYYSTKILEFTIYCPACSNKIKVETDPENCDYKFTEGAKRILNTEHATDMEFMQDPEEKKKKILNPIYRLEGKQLDINKAEEIKPKIQALYDVQERMRNDFDINVLMRKKFKQEKIEIDEKEKEQKQIKNFALEMEDLDAKEMQQIKNVKFLHPSQPAISKIQNRRVILNSGIFQDQRNKEIEALQLKLKNLPKNTQKQLKFELKNQTAVKFQQRNFLSIESSDV